MKFSEDVIINAIKKAESQGIDNDVPVKKLAKDMPKLKTFCDRVVEKSKEPIEGFGGKFIVDREVVDVLANISLEAGKVITAGLKKQEIKKQVKTSDGFDMLDVANYCEMAVERKIPDEGTDEHKVQTVVYGLLEKEGLNRKSLIRGLGYNDKGTKDEGAIFEGAYKKCEVHFDKLLKFLVDEKIAVRKHNNYFLITPEPEGNDPA